MKARQEVTPWRVWDRWKSSNCIDNFDLETILENSDHQVEYVFDTIKQTCSCPLNHWYDILGWEFVRFLTEKEKSCFRPISSLF